MKDISYYGKIIYLRKKKTYVGNIVIYYLSQIVIYFSFNFFNSALIYKIILKLEFFQMEK